MAKSESEQKPEYPQANTYGGWALYVVMNGNPKSGSAGTGPRKEFEVRASTGMVRDDDPRKKPEWLDGGCGFPAASSQRGVDAGPCPKTEEGACACRTVPFPDIRPGSFDQFESKSTQLPKDLSDDGPSWLPKY